MRNRFVSRRAPLPASLLAPGLLAATLSPAAGAQDPALYENEARALVDAVLAESALGIDREMDGDLAAWADTVMGDALSGQARAGGSAVVAGSPEPGDIGRALAPERERGAEVIVFMSLSVPEPSWRQWSAEAARIGAPLVLRGVAGGGFAETAGAIAARGAQGGAAIDPRLFRLFRIAHVPAVAVVPGGVGPCTTPGCSRDAPPPHDLVSGNIGLEAALEAIARDGGPGRDAARRRLNMLGGEPN